MKKNPVLMIQDIRFYWTKASRAAADAHERLAVPRAHLLPQPWGDDSIRHEILVDERNGFVPLHLVRTSDDPAWGQDLPMRPDNMRARRVKDGFEVSLLRPWDAMLTTKWPAYLASPVFRGGIGDSVRIDWNGRFHASLLDSNRSCFYEEHTIWVTLQEAPADSTFLTLTPGKHIDLRTTIY